MTLRTLFAALLLGLCLPLHAATEVIPLNYRTADDVLGVVRGELPELGDVHHSRPGRLSAAINTAPSAAPAAMLASTSAMKRSRPNRLGQRPRPILSENSQTIR